MSIAARKANLEQSAVTDGSACLRIPGPTTSIQLLWEEMSAVRPRKLPYKPVIGELENRTEYGS